MRILSHRWGRVGFATLLMLLLGVAPSADARRLKVEVEIAPTGTLSPGAQSMTIEITASCAKTWNVLEALVTVSQAQAFGQGFFPLTCTGRRSTFVVTVTSADAPFQPGAAQGSALVLIERRGRTQEAQDSGIVQLVPSS